MRTAIGTSHAQVLPRTVNRCLRYPLPEPNIYDVCLHRDCLIWEELVSCGGLQTLCCPQGRKPYLTKPWISMPKEGRRFKPIGILAVADIALPFTGVDQQVLSLDVPLGYDGVISDIVCEIVAAGDTGFVEGSGDIQWRLSAFGHVGGFRRYLRDLSTVQVSLGSLITPSPTPRGGLLVKSKNTVIWSVALTAGAEARINPEARIVCSIAGWWYPR